MVIRREQELNKIEKQLKVAVVRAKAYLKIKNIRIKSKKYNELNNELIQGVFLALIVNKLESFDISELGIVPGGSSGPDGWGPDIPNTPLNEDAIEKWHKYQEKRSLYGAIFLVEECGELSKELTRIELLAPKIRSNLIMDLTSNVADSFANIRLVFLSINLPKSEKEHIQKIKQITKDAGKASGKARKEGILERNKRIASTGRSLLAGGSTLPHEVVSKIYCQVKLSKKTIRNILQDQGVIKKRKSKRN